MCESLTQRLPTDEALAIDCVTRALILSATARPKAVNAVTAAIETNAPAMAYSTMVKPSSSFKNQRLISSFDPPHLLVMTNMFQISQRGVDDFITAGSIRPKTGGRRFPYADVGLHPMVDLGINEKKRDVSFVRDFPAHSCEF